MKYPVLMLSLALVVPNAWSQSCPAEIATLPAFDEVMDAQDNGLAVIFQKDQAGVLDIRSGALMLAPEFEEIYLDDPILARKDGKWGILDAQGKVVRAPVFSDAEPFFEGLAAVADEQGRWGFVNAQGEMVIAPQYDAVSSFSDGHAAVRKQGLWGLIDRDGQVVVAPQYTAMNAEEGGLWAVEKDERRGIINAQGEMAMAFAPWYINGVYVLDAEKNLFQASHREMDASMLLDQNAEQIVLPGWETRGMVAGYDSGADLFHVFTVEGEFGEYHLVDRAGQEVGTGNYSMAGDFADGLAPVCLSKGRCGYLNRQGELTIAADFEIVEPFADGIAVVIVDGKSYLIDKTGQRLSKGYDFIVKPGEVRQGDKSGVIDRTGQEILPPVYERVQNSDFQHDRIFLKKDGAWQFVGRDGCVYAAQP